MPSKCWHTHTRPARPSRVLRALGVRTVSGALFKETHECSTSSEQPPRRRSSGSGIRLITPRPGERQRQCTDQIVYIRGNENIIIDIAPNSLVILSRFKSSYTRSKLYIIYNFSFSLVILNIISIYIS